MSQTTWIVEQIKATCAAYKNRSAGTERVRACMKGMAEQLRTWADKVEEEPFSMHPHAFMGSIPLLATCDILGVICFWISYFNESQAFAWAALGLFCFALLLLVLEYVLYRRAFDFLFPMRRGMNVFACRKAAVESRQRIILCGHADAAYEMTFFAKLKAWQIYALIGSASIGMILCVVSSLLHVLGLFGRDSLFVLCVIQGALLFVFVLWLFFINWRLVVDGANDNLTGCYISMGILKEMSENNLRLAYTDVCCLITDGEESGLRGAMAYAEQHRQELIESKSYVIAIDTIHDSKALMIYHRGINFTQKNSPDVCSLLHQAGLNCGVNIPNTDFYPGATDAEAFSRMGIHAAALCAVQHTPCDYYHTRFDTPDNLGEEGIELTGEIVKEAVRVFEGSAGE